VSYEEIREPKEVKLRKPKQCEWCGEQILAGENAVARVYKYDGDFHDERSHPECYEAMGEAPNYLLMDGWTPGDFERGCV